MNRFKRVICVVAMLLPTYVFCQCPSPQGPQDEMPPKKEIPDEHSSGSADITVAAPSTPNEINGTKGYDALGDTLQWVAVTASSPYALCFECHPNLASFIIENDLE